MRLKKAFCLLLASVLTFACLTLEAGAVQAEPEADTLSIERASGRFSVDVSKQSTFTADSDFFLDVGETVTITATYTPRSASVDFPWSVWAIIQKFRILLCSISATSLPPQSRRIVSAFVQAAR